MFEYFTEWIFNTTYSHQDGWDGYILLLVVVVVVVLLTIVVVFDIVGQ